MKTTKMDNFGVMTYLYSLLSGCENKIYMEEGECGEAYRLTYNRLTEICIDIRAEHDFSTS